MATSKVTSYGVDLYKLRVNSGGAIDLDLGGIGTATILGNLNVTGTTTTITSAELAIADNAITVNDGEIGAGVTLGTAGIIIDRGTVSNANLLFDESLNGGNGGFVIKDDAENYFPISVDSVRTKSGTDLVLIGDSSLSGIVTVTGTVDYEKNIWPYTGSDITLDAGQPSGISIPNDPDALVNVQGLLDYVRVYNENNTPTYIAAPSGTGDTRVEVFDTDNGDLSNQVTLSVNGTSVMEVFETTVDINNVQISGNTITTNVVDSNLILQANGFGQVQIPESIELTKTTDPSPPADGVRVYSKEEADGGTGIYYINELGTTDELISRNKSLLFSIIF